MGFWSACKSFAKKVGRTIGSGIETVGRVIKSETVENMGRKLRDMCTEVDKLSQEVSELSSYIKESARLSETIRINESLSNFSLNLQKQADELEELSLKESKIYFEYLIEQLRETNGSNGVKINLNKMKREFLKIERNIRGSFKVHLAKRISLDDTECLRILQLEEGLEKKQRMECLGNKVLLEAREQLCDNIRECILEQQEYIEDQVIDKLEEVICSLKELNDKVLEFEKIKVNNEDKIELEKAKCISKIEIINDVLNLMD
ncbi:hypothetical protein NEH72_08105 [Turicibacter sp. 1E2]|uniref:hypothetical protein n=1 Tax=Turicibacter sp. 1E2 TaxID=2951143 RepID=UPI0021D48B2D|nr:hypothetical protein [Turicibacter sp. 1E2]MCU7209805.1 hypothetical protein [Turicibacter sp. 1E2]